MNIDTLRTRFLGVVRSYPLPPEDRMVLVDGLLNAVIAVEGLMQCENCGEYVKELNRERACWDGC